jgi:signal transduction histidine kinase/membrane protein implicated in regulation of membrane protease activity
LSNFIKSNESLNPRNPLAVLKPYLAVLASLSFVLGLIAAAPAMGSPVPVNLLLLIPVLIGAFLGGLGVGLFAMILALAAAHLLPGESAFDLRQQFPDADQQVRFVFFIAGSLLLIWIGHRYRLFRSEAREASRRQHVLEQEIVRRRKLEESLVRSQRTVKSQIAEIENIYATAPVGLCFLDRELRFVRINRRLAEMLGIPVEASIGKSVLEAVPEIGAALSPLLRRVIVSGKAILEKEISAGEGRGVQAERMFLASFLPIKEDDGFVSGVNIAVKEITRQIESGEDAWRDSQARLQLALEAGRMAVWERDLASGGMTWLDPTNIHSAVDFEQQFLAWVQNIAERNLPDFSEAGERPVESCRQEFRIVLPDGQWNWVEARGLRVLDSRESCRRLVGVLADVTDRKRAEESLSHVIEAEEALRKADRRKDEFIALLAHELRNPLAPILTSAQLLKRRGFERPELIASATEGIERQVKYLTRLINDLLDISRAARGKLNLNFEVTDMASVVAHAIELCRPVIDKNQQELVLSGTDQSLYLWGDPARLSQIVANLLMNAAKFTPMNGRIELAVQRTEREISIKVQDNGIGIEPDAIEHIFEPFVQLERPLHDGHSGLGVGLALVKSLVEMHGGRISVVSHGKDRGSEFWVRLPLYDPSSQRRTGPMEREGQGQSVQAPVRCDEAHLS